MHGLATPPQVPLSSPVFGFTLMVAASVLPKNKVFNNTRVNTKRLKDLILFGRSLLVRCRELLFLGPSPLSSLCLLRTSHTNRAWSLFALVLPHLRSPRSESSEPLATSGRASSVVIETNLPPPPSSFFLFLSPSPRNGLVSTVNSVAERLQSSVTVRRQHQNHCHLLWNHGEREE